MALRKAEINAQDQWITLHRVMGVAREERPDLAQENLSRLRLPNRIPPSSRARSWA